MAAALAVFVGCLWVLMAVRLSWMPARVDDRWLPALGIATFVGTVVFAPLGWWAGREDPVPAGAVPGPVAVGGSVEQHAKASGDGRVNQAGGDMHIHGDRA
jgi:hypothetical protein